MYFHSHALIDCYSGVLPVCFQFRIVQLEDSKMSWYWYSRHLVCMNGEYKMALNLIDFARADVQFWIYRYERENFWFSLLLLQLISLAKKQKSRFKTLNCYNCWMTHILPDGRIQRCCMQIQGIQWSIIVQCTCHIWHVTHFIWANHATNWHPPRIMRTYISESLAIDPNVWVELYPNCINC